MARRGLAVPEPVSDVEVLESNVRTKIIGLMVLGALASTQAQAADVNYRRPYAQPYAQPYTVNQPLNMYSWAGPYVGGTLGYQWGTTSNSGTKPSGVMGGVQAGYNWQFGQFVAGVEADFNASGANDTFAPYKFSNPWFGTLRGRAGYALNNMLFYGTAGFAMGSIRAETIGATESKWVGGWTIGAGAEIGVTQNWSVKAEYLYVNLNQDNFLMTGLPHGSQFNVLRLGVNYKF